MSRSRAGRPLTVGCACLSQTALSWLLSKTLFFIVPYIEICVKTPFSLQGGGEIFTLPKGESLGGQHWYPFGNYSTKKCVLYGGIFSGYDVYATPIVQG